MPTYIWRGDELVDGYDSYPPVPTAPWEDGLRIDDPPPWPSRYPWRNEMGALPEKVKDIWRMRWVRVKNEYTAKGVAFPLNESMAWRAVKQEIAEGKFPEPEPEPDPPREEVRVAAPEIPKKKVGRGRRPEGEGHFL